MPTQLHYMARYEAKADKVKESNLLEVVSENEKGANALYALQFLKKMVIRGVATGGGCVGCRTPWPYRLSAIS